MMASIVAIRQTVNSFWMFCWCATCIQSIPIGLNAGNTFPFWGCITIPLVVVVYLFGLLPLDGSPDFTLRPWSGRVIAAYTEIPSKAVTNNQ
jgi:hypothetical protein